MAQGRVPHLNRAGDLRPGATGMVDGDRCDRRGTGRLDRMKAVIAREPGGPEVLQVVERPVPELHAGEVLIRVTAAGVNRPDLMQRNGSPIPSGVTDVLGLEAAGIVVVVGTGVDEFAIGDRVMALLSGGGYAEYCVAQAAHCLPVPAGLSLHDAAGCRKRRLPCGITCLNWAVCAVATLR